MVKVAIITYSCYGHITTIAREIKKGVEAAGGEVTLFRVPETLPDDVLEQMNAAEKPEDFLIANGETLTDYDAFLFGVPTRFGNVPSQWAEFWDKTGAIWVQGSLWGKPAGVFVSTGTYGGGQEATVKTCMNYLVHHGMVFVPLGYKYTFAELSNVEDIHGGSPWGAGTLAGADGSRQPSSLELRMAKTQGKTFYETASKLCDKKPSTKSSKNMDSKPSAKQNTSATGKAEVKTSGTTTQQKPTETRPKQKTKFNPSKNCVIM